MQGCPQDPVLVATRRKNQKHKNKRRQPTRAQRRAGDLAALRIASEQDLGGMPPLKCAARPKLDTRKTLLEGLVLQPVIRIRPFFLLALSTWLLPVGLVFLLECGLLQGGGGCKVSWLGFHFTHKFRVVESLGVYSHFCELL